ncbi:MAG: hypothetical protein GX369_06645 [Euryarchaeota archaeon]|nr:hypothetical protein [Euryarchaeota archaeon]
MNSKERFLAALELDAVDRVPLFYQHLGAAKWLLQNTGLRIRDGFHNPKTFAELAMAAYDMYGFDNVMAGWGDLLVAAKAHGMEWKFPERDFYPRPTKYVDMTEIDNIQPVDPLEDPTWSVLIRATEIMKDQIGNEVAIIGCVETPNMIASEVVGMENLLMGCLMDPDIIAKLLKTITQSVIRYGEVVNEVGVDGVFMEGSMAGGEMVDVSMFEQFDGKYIAQVIDSYKSMGLNVLLHNCSEQPFWKEQLETGPTAIHLQLSSVPISEVAPAVKGNTCLIAGIEHRELLLNHTPHEVKVAVRRTIEEWGRDPGLIMGPGCELPYRVPLDNIRAFRESVEQYGKM